MSFNVSDSFNNLESFQYDCNIFVSVWRKIVNAHFDTNRNRSPNWTVEVQEDSEDGYKLVRSESENGWNERFCSQSWKGNKWAWQRRNEVSELHFISPRCWLCNLQSDLPSTQKLVQLDVELSSVWCLCFRISVYAAPTVYQLQA